MNDQDYIRKGVELAGWEQWTDITDDSQYIVTPCGRTFRDDDPIAKDALAAQLVRQVDALGAFHCEPYRAIVCDVDPESQAHSTIETVKGPDRTMNTLRAIVDSKVLE